MVAYDDGIFIDTQKMMANLDRYLKRANVKFVRTSVKSFDEIEEKFIFNCSGLGSADLNADSKMVSVQGHLIMLKDHLKFKRIEIHDFGLFWRRQNEVGANGQSFILYLS